MLCSWSRRVSWCVGLEYASLSKSSVFYCDTAKMAQALWGASCPQRELQGSGFSVVSTTTMHLVSWQLSQESWKEKFSQLQIVHRGVWKYGKCEASPAKLHIYTGVEEEPHSLWYNTPGTPAGLGLGSVLGSMNTCGTNWFPLLHPLWVNKLHSVHVNIHTHASKRK